MLSVVKAKKALLLLLAAALMAFPAMAQDQGQPGEALKRGPSGLPLPRFVSLKSGRVNMRVGPGTQYAVSWLYLKPGLPIEITQEYDNWRRVRDADGAEGWINQALLSGRRTAVVAPWFQGRENAAVPLLAAAEEGAREVAQVQPGVIGDVSICNGNWCRINFAGHEGWMSQKAVWGVYPGETIKE